MATYVKFQPFVEQMAHKLHDLETDTLTVALTNTAPTAGLATLSQITEISYTNVGTGRDITTTSSAQTSGTYKLVLEDRIISASGGTVGPFRYVVIYNDTATNDELICYFDYGSSITLQDTETLTIDFDGTNGLFTLA